MRECTVHWYLLWGIVSLMTLHLTSTMPTPETTVPSTTTLGTTTTTTAREHVSPMSESLQHLANQLMQLNATSQITFDTRTPPKLREQMRKDSSHSIPNDYGHPGVAEPVEEEISLLEEENKRMNINFYKLIKPTTDSGLSTWILLSGQSSTNKPTKKPIVQAKNSTEDKPVKPIFKRKSTTTTITSTTTIKPSLMKKSTTMVATTLKATIATASVTEKPERNHKVNKTSNINKSVNNKTVSRVTNAKPIKSTKVPLEITSTTSTPSTKAQEFIKVPTKSSNNSNQLQPEAKEGTLDLTTTISNDSLKKTKRPTTSVNGNNTKRKKNKTKRKKPIAEDKMDRDKENSTKIATKIKDKPIGTQIYNYLSREVMPTVGVGLVGLVVTAGLASYFLYPFGPLRRSYEVDRKDKEGNYHYTDEYSGGIAEEEAIGKVIAGMPNNNYYNSRLQNSRNTYGMNYEFVNGVSNPNRGGYQPSFNRFRNVDQRFMEGSVETVALNPMTTYKTEEVIIGSPKKSAFHNHKDTYEIIGLNKDKIDEFTNDKSHLQSSAFSSDTTESVTPSVVPEHGPRTLEKLRKDDAATPEKIFVVQSVPAEPEPLYASMDHSPRRRRKRDNKKDRDNEIEDNEVIHKVIKKTSGALKPTSTMTTTLTTNPTITFLNKESTENTIYDTTTIIVEEDINDSTQTDNNDKNDWQKPADKPESIFSLLKDLVYFKIRLGLQLLQEKAQTVSRYIANVQEQMHIQYKHVNHSFSATRS